jgi:hypothetical protein
MTAQQQIENADWLTPNLPDPETLPDNTKAWGPFYFWRGEPRRHQFPLSFAVTREITEPWRRGVGLVARWLHSAVAVGIWWPGSAPEILLSTPREKNLRRVVRRHRRLARQ